MGAVRACLATEFRLRWRPWCVVALLVGLAGAVVLSTAAAARRTNTAYPRFLNASHASDLIVAPLYDHFDIGLAKLPGIAAVSHVAALNALPLKSDGTSIPFETIGGLDRVFLRDVDRPKLVAGRRFRIDDATEAMADVRLAHALHLRPGSSLSFTLRADQPGAKAAEHTFHVRIVGIVAARTDAVVVSVNDAAPQLFVTPLLVRAAGPSMYGFDALFIRLRPHTSTASFTHAVTTLAARYTTPQNQLSKQLFVITENDQVARIERAIRPQAASLALFAGFAALGALFVLGQVISRQVFLSSSDFSVLRAMGMTTTQLFTVAMIEVAVGTAIGVLIAVAVAVAPSSRLLFGPARVIEPHPGVAFDWTVLAVGAACVMVLLIARALWPAWRIASASGDRYDPLNEATASRVAKRVATLTASASSLVGVRLALEPGRGRRAVPLRSAVLSTVIGVGAVTAAFTFSTNLVHLERTPPLYGQTWDVALDAQFGSPSTRAIAAQLANSPGVDGWSFGDYASLRVGNHDVPGIALFTGHGTSPVPTILQGHMPTADDEIVLGTKTMQQLRTQVGGTLTIPIAGKDHKFRVVGRVVLPAFTRGNFTPTGLGQGVVLWGPLISRTLAAQGSGTGPSGTANFALVHVAAGPRHARDVAQLVDRLSRSRECPPGACVWLTAQRPTDIVNYGRVQSTPLALAALLAVFAVASLAHLLITSVRRRRRDLAVLKTLGFSRAQVSATVAWQATTLIAIALAIGVPVGMVLGHWLWSAFASRLGIATTVRFPLSAIVISVPVALAIGNMLAAGPGWMGGRVQPARVLRLE
ncbi:MAG: hypothetical protein JWL83_3409 [Actinomycetia bacterium]|nr:hypothetical protein [Actinomycetes bacterium]